MDNYGMKATVTCVLNDEKYDLGFTFSDSEGNDVDKQLSGNIDDIEADITKALMNVYVDALISDRKKKEPKLTINTKEDAGFIAINREEDKPVTAVVDRFAELEEENRRLNEKVDAILNGTTSTPTTKVEPAKAETPRRKPDNSIHHRRSTAKDFEDIFAANDILDLFRFLGR